MTWHAIFSVHRYARQHLDNVDGITDVQLNRTFQADIKQLSFDRTLSALARSWLGHCNPPTLKIHDLEFFSFIDSMETGNVITK